MLNIAIAVALGMLATAVFLNLWRLIRGPAAVDRVLALDTLAINTIALVVLLGISLASSTYFEAALLIAMMSFVGTVGLCKFLLNRNVME